MLVAWLLALVGIVIIVKAAIIMTAQKSKWERVAKDCEIDSAVIAVNRGDILSANGELLATNVPEYKIYLDYSIVEEDSARHARLQHKKDSVFLSKSDSIAMGLNLLFPNKSVAWYKERLAEGFRKQSRHWLLYPYRISYLDYKEVKKIPFLKERVTFSGFHTEKFDKIDKPYGSLAGRTLGDVDRNTGHGLTGLQAAFDKLLKGEPGVARKIKTMNAYLPVLKREPVAGANIHTTLDVDMQDFCENALVEKLKEINGIYGVAILMEVETGDIKALVNMERGKDGGYYDMQNYALTQMMQPGSVFKTISLTAALEAGKIDLNTTVDCSTGAITIGGHTIKDASHKSNKVIGLREVLGYSSNVGVIKLITKGYGGSIESQQQFCDDVLKLGLASDLKLDIPGAKRPNIPSPKTLGEYWSASSLGSISIGYSTEVPPISLIAFYNGLANGGRMMRPRLVTHITRNGETIKSIPPMAIKERMCSEKTVHDITECLKWVVSDGLGGAARSENFTVAGKTGTARVQQQGHMGEYLITFAGFWPAEKPKYTCVVSMRKAGGGSGGGMCGPVFKQIAEYVMSQGSRYIMADQIDTLHSIPPSLDFTNLLYAGKALGNLGYIVPSAWTNDKSAAQFGKVDIVDNHARADMKQTGHDILPDLTGMGARDALFMLEKLNMRVKLNGVGKVVAQSLPYGHKIKPNDYIVLTLDTKHKSRPVTKSLIKNDSTKKTNGDSLPMQYAAPNAHQGHESTQPAPHN